MTLTRPSVPTRTSIDSVRAIQPLLASGGYDNDENNTDPTDNFLLLGETGVQRIFVPREFGGEWDGNEYSGWRELIETMVAIGTGDGPTCQNWGTTSMAARSILGATDLLPETTRREIARRILEENLRICEANAETGVTRPMTARRVEGGIVLTGTKSFVTNSGGQGLANVGTAIEGETERYHAIVDLSDPALVQRHDWDNMGQRGTQSQTIVFDDVFVADGWYYEAHWPAAPLNGAVILLHASLNQGIGQGAFVELLKYAGSMTRGSLPRFTSPIDDPMMTRRIGELSAKLAAGRALLFDAASQLENFDGSSDPAEVTAAAFRAKIVSVAASLDVSSELFEITGARSTSNKYRFDRFWRNARTFASHDPSDAKAVFVGEHELNALTSTSR